MTNPFPGMNPYLEQPEFWSDFHAQLVAACARELAPKLLPKYRVVTNKWTYKITDTTMIGVGRPDVSLQKRRDGGSQSQPIATTSRLSTQPVAVRIPLLEEVQQSYLEVRDAATKEVVTAIEVISPANKRSDGRRQYDRKRQGILESRTHLVEIDLLRNGEPLPLEADTLEADTLESHYRILVSRSQHRPMADLYAFDLGDRIPNIPIPLHLEDLEPMLAVQDILNDLYEQLGYAYFIDYGQAPPPPWSVAEVQHWIS